MRFLKGRVGKYGALTVTYSSQLLTDMSLFIHISHPFEPGVSPFQSRSQRAPSAASTSVIYNRFQVRLSQACGLVTLPDNELLPGLVDGWSAPDSENVLGERKVRSSYALRSFGFTDALSETPPLVRARWDGFADPLKMMQVSYPTAVGVSARKPSFPHLRLCCVTVPHFWVLIPCCSRNFCNVLLWVPSPRSIQGTQMSI